MYVRDVISMRVWATMAMVVALLFTSVRAAHCERSRDVLAASIATELADAGAPAKDIPLSHAPVEDGGSFDSACTSMTAVVPARVSTDVRPASTTDASYVTRTLIPLRNGFSLERPPRCC